MRGCTRFCSTMTRSVPPPIAASRRDKWACSMDGAFSPLCGFTMACCSRGSGIGRGCSATPRACALQRLIEANQAWNSTLRVMIVRNRGGMWEGHYDREFDTIALTADVSEWGEGVRLGVVPHARHAASEFSGAKILSWSQNLAFLDRAKERGLDEVVLLNERGEISECTSANLFIVTKGKVLTPPLVSGCLPGVTRALLLEEVRVPGLSINEKTLLPDDIESADEVFITSTTRELLPVDSIEGWNIRTSRESRDRLAEAFRRCVDSYVAPRRRPVAV